MFKVVGYKKGSWLEYKEDLKGFKSFEKAKKFIESFKNMEDTLLVVLDNEENPLYCRIFNTYFTFDSKSNADYLEGVCDGLCRYLGISRFRLFSEGETIKIEDEQNNIVAEDVFSGSDDSLECLVRSIISIGLKDIMPKGDVENFYYNKTGDNTNLFYMDSGVCENSYDVFLCDVHSFVM